MTPLPKPTEETAKAARAALRELRHAKGPSWQLTSISIRSPGGEEKAGVPLPEGMFAVVVEMLEHLARGASVRVVPEDEEVTSQQAADLLKVSRPFLIRRLESGEIPFRKVGRHRRVRISDLMAYKDRDDAERRSAADELAAEAQKHDLGY